MEDVHMEDARPVTDAEDSTITSSSDQSAEQLVSTKEFDSKLTTLASEVTSSHNGNDHDHSEQGTVNHSYPSKAARTKNEDTLSSQAEYSTADRSANNDVIDNKETNQSDVVDKESKIDIDKTLPLEEKKINIEPDVQQNSDDSTIDQNASQHEATSRSVKPDKYEPDVKINVVTEPTSTGSLIKTTTDQSIHPNPLKLSEAEAPTSRSANANEVDVNQTVTATDAHSLTEAPIEGTVSSANNSAVKTSAESLTALTPPPPPPVPVRSYIPQFKFTTFAAMTQLPTRNVTSNFLKTEKNFVLKDMSRIQKRRKRKTDEGTVQKGGDKDANEGDENELEALDKDKDKETEGNATLKKKKNDKFTAIRRGIFADDDDDEDDEKLDKVDDDVDDQKQDDEDEYLDTSDSDSEESVVNETDENGEAKSSSEVGKKTIVIHPGSRILRIGRASDAYPIAIPHCIARRIHTLVVTSTDHKQLKAAESAATRETELEAVAAQSGTENGDVEVDEDNAMDVDGHEDDASDIQDAVNDRYLQDIEYDLKLRMKAAKRRPVPNARTQVRSFNTSTRPEKILDHNDPYKVEWTDPKAEGEFIIGQKALNLPPSKDHNFKLFWPIVSGMLNDRDYATPRLVVSDLEAIWTKVIEEDLGIDPKKLRKHYALLVIPDLYNKLYVSELVNMLLKSMQFRGVMIQQESVCASFGAGVSAACVVDIGAEVTKISCVEDGICIPNSRAMLKYGGDDITRIFAALVRRMGFPYEELDLAQTYDWRLMEELKEKWCTMNEADLTVQVYSFFVRRPEKQTLKYQVKVYDEVALSPMCLFFPNVIRRWIEEREINPNFAKVTNYEDINEDAPPISLTNQAQKKTNAAAIAAAARAGTPSLSVVGEETSVNGNATPTVGTPGATPAPTPAPTPVPSGPSTTAGSGSTPAPVGPNVPAEPPIVVFAMEPSVTTTNKSWEIAGTIGKDHFSSLVALDVVVAQSISNCGSEERSKKLYGSIILVGGGGMIKGFDRVLEDRLFQALPATLTTVEKVEVLPSPRDMDPRLLVWKGGSVLSKLETAKEMWIKPLEWELMGRKVLRDKSLFVWSKDS
ncbi:actin-like protein arp8 [Lobosporangium transversale]|nr:actin-like protein arp8 [Lobosporangium transversale]